MTSGNLAKDLYAASEAGADLRKKLLGTFSCLQCKMPLSFTSPTALTCSRGHSYPIIRGIPRFVTSDEYVDSFSFEWNTHNTTQLDSITGQSSSTEMFKLKTGLSPEEIRGKLVLDAGVGAGRFCDVASSWGAHMIGVDLSYAVEASSVNFAKRDNVLIAQADIGNLPFAPETFDFIFSIGVLHHTPNTRAYFERLVPLVKRGGSISIWVYPTETSYANRAEWIPYTHRIPDKMFYEWCRWVVPMLRRHPKSALGAWFQKIFSVSNQGLGIENDILDTFDGYSPRYHGIHSPEEVEGWFRDAGLVNVHQPSDWATSVRGTKP